MSNQEPNVTIIKTARNTKQTEQVVADASCCSVTEQATCCGQSAKASCCGSTSPAGSCGCK